jgi:LuxR family transcriptional regulator, quorum-sensing system regulator BjaR1
MADALTRREIEVLSHLAHGETARQVAEALAITARTVSAHTQSARQKLDAANCTQAVAIALRDGMIEL